MIITKRAKLFTIRNLPKVCSSPRSNSLDTLKTLAFLRKFSTNATEPYSEFHRNPDHVNEFHNDPVRKNGNFGGYNGQYSNGSFQGSVNGNYNGNGGHFRPDTNDNYIGSVGMNQQNGVSSAGNLNYGNHNGNVGNLWQNSSENYSRNNGVNQQNGSAFQSSGVSMNYGNDDKFQNRQGGNYIGRNETNLHGPNNVYTNSGGDFQRSPVSNVANNGNFNQFQQSPSVYNSLNSGMYQQDENAGQNQWNLNGNVGNSYNNGAGQYQQSSSNYYNSSVGSYQQGQYGYKGEHVGQDQQNWNTNTDSAEATEDNQLRGTLEELDIFCKEGKVKEAMEVLDLLEKKQITVDLPQYLRLVYACGEAKALKEAKIVHAKIIGSVSPLKVSTYNKILEMYSKCGSMEDAKSLFNSMSVKNLTSWDTMIAWLTENELPQEAIDLFEQFKETSLKPDGQLFITVFSAFSVLGEIEEGMLHFEIMCNKYGIEPSMKHYLSVVDMLGNSGYLDEALEFIEKMPMEPSVDIWECLMNISRIQGNLELGDRCAEIVDQLDPTRLTEQSKSGLIAVKPSDIAKEKEKKKLSSQNLLEVKSKVHEYRAGDTSHPETDRIYVQLRGLRQQMKEAGYVAETRFVLHDIDQEGKEDALLSHSERLAVSHGFLTTPARQPIRVIKNLRVCGDCHNACKIISKLVGRQLIMRDTKRFHHFQDGVCSCKDYW